MSATADLGAVLADYHDKCIRLPCQTGDPERFYEGTYTELIAVARECDPCPIRALCGAAGDEMNERSGIWGGQPRDPQILKKIQKASNTNGTTA